MVRKELHAEHVIESADAVQLDPSGVVDIQPLLLSNCKHGLSVEPPRGQDKRDRLQMGNEKEQKRTLVQLMTEPGTAMIFHLKNIYQAPKSYNIALIAQLATVTHCTWR